MRPSRNEVLMEMAEVVSKRSTCSRKSVGCVVAREGRVLVMGYNGAPSGLAHCNHDCVCGTQEAYHYDDCPAGLPCEIAVHAEANAIAFAAKHGVSLLNADLYTTCSPCRFCAQLIINSGINQVFYLEQYREIVPVTLLESAGVLISRLVT